MKKLFSTLLAVMSFSLLMAQAADVPSGVQIAFKNQYKSAPVWTVTNQGYVAKWEADGKKMTAVYTKDEQSTLLRKETDVQLSELSTGTQTNVKERFIGEGSPYTFSRAFKIEGFGTSVEGCEFKMQNGDITNVMTVFFDANGTMTKRELN